MDRQQSGLGILVDNDLYFGRRGKPTVDYPKFHDNQNYHFNLQNDTVRGKKHASKLYMEELPDDGTNTLKKIVFTPPRKENNSNDSKATLHRGNVGHYAGNLFAGNFAGGYPGLPANVIISQGNKENSSSNFNSSNTSSHDESAFKIPAKKEENSNPFLHSVKVNLNDTFEKKVSSVVNENNLFGERPQKFFNKTLISSSSSSDRSQTKSNNSQLFSQGGISQGLSQGISQGLSQSPIVTTQQTITESLLDGFSNKSKVSEAPTTTSTLPRTLSLKFNSAILAEERYKLLKIRDSRKEKFKDNKSTSRIPMDVEYEDLVAQESFEKKRVKTAHSVKKFYASEIILTDSTTNQKKAFRIFKDTETGISEYWQQYIRHSQGDEDVASDEEQINRATRNNLECILQDMERLRGKGGDPVILINSRLLN